MKRKIFIVAIIGLVLVLATFGVMKVTGNLIKTEQVTIETNYGNIVVELYPDKAPITVENFMKYVEDEFYSGTIFHRVISGFMIQGGGYTTDGVEKETYSPIKLESDNELSNTRGTIAMARTNVADSATSQFYINLVDNTFLDYSPSNEGYAVFGKVVSGMDIVDKIAKVQTDSNDVPTEEIIIESITVN